jgi:tetratricopeptide (TPR) repeat protein
MAGLQLEVRDFANLTRWRWLLLDESTGASLADHQVRLDPGDWQFQAFGDLTGYLSWHVTPDRRREDETRIVGEVGAWIGSQVLGPVAGALARKSPATVRVVVPEAAEALLFRPLELAHADGRPLSLQDVTLVMQVGREGGDVAPVGQRLRVLGLFSLPEGGRSLNLRRERHSLVRLIQEIATTGKAAEVRVLQYGVTRERLWDVLEETEGWDIIHVSGHARPGELLLETAAGKQDLVTAAELAELLEPARERVKLVTVAACWSAAVTLTEERRLLGLPAPDQRAQDDSRDPADGESAAGALATELAARLGCAVLAMRYPVGDEFAMALTEKLYDLLARQGQPLPRAIGMTLRQLLTGSKYPALSAATPALFGTRAADLLVTAPDRDRPEDCDAAALKMAGFPPQPERFVGRTGMMARASAALAARSGIPGVLLHGMPGGGKTACALELTYGQEHAFDRLVWYKAPDEGMDITGALTDFALTMERYLDGFQMADVLAGPGKLAGFLPLLTELMEQRRVLIVIDNAESLLASGGHWRDRWGQLVSALTAHTGLGRVILTSRRVPAGVTGLQAEGVDALSADEALLLIRELPHLRALIDRAIPGINSHVARRLARQALDIAQGHPKLLELADGQASNPGKLAHLVEAGEQAWLARGGLPEGFFTVAETAATGDDYLYILAIWTQAVADTITPGERELFWFLCCLEERDRQRVIVDPIWPQLWNVLGRDGEPPGLDQALSALAAQGLAAIRAGTDVEDESYAIHPAVASAGRAQAGEPFHDAVAGQAAAYWEAAFRYASGEAGGGERTGLLVRAGIGAIPYLMRLEQWTQAAAMLERAFNRDPSRANAAVLLPAIRQITNRLPNAAGLLARVLRVVDPTAAGVQMRAHLDATVARGDFRAASVAAGRLIDLYRRNGLLAEAMALADQKVGYARQAGLGPWTELSDKARWLQIVTAMGQAGEVLAEVERLRSQMRTLPASPDPGETATPRNVREVVFETGRDAASLLGRWNDALDFSAQLVASMRDRRAPATEIARARFGAYGPLLRLGHTDEALSLLRECRQAFEDANDVGMLGMVLSALADTEYQRGQGDAAIRLQRDALRYKYRAMDIPHIALSYHNLGHYLHTHARQPAPALACHLAAALIRALTRTAGTDESVQAAAADLRVFGTNAIVPTDVPDLCSQLSDSPGTDLPSLIAKISSDPDATGQVLRDIITQARLSN